MPLAVVSGASSGIGAATACVLAEQGYDLWLLARNQTRLDQVAQQLSGSPGRVRCSAMDLADGNAVVAAAAPVSKELGTADVVIHSAGAGQWKYLEETNPEEALSMMAAPYFAAFHLNYALLPGMLKRGSGHLIHVGSPASIAPWPGATGYTAARFALRGLNEALNQDLHGTGVRTSHMVFGKVSSGYFEHNPGTEALIPWANRFAPTLTPEQCARRIMVLIRRPKREAIYPWMVRCFFAFPRMTRWLGRKTGRRR